MTISPSAHLKAFENIAKTNQSLTVDLAIGNGYSVLDIIKMTEKVTGKKVNYEIAGRREGDPPELYGKSNLADELLGWTPEFSELETLVKSTWNAYKKANP